MNKFFKSAVERYNNILSRIGSNGFLLSPISETDAEIIGEIKIIFNKFGIKEISAILDNYKEYKDEEIYETLLQWNIDNPNPIGKSISDGVNLEAEEISQAPSYIKIKDIVMIQYDFRCFQLNDVIEDDEMVYELIINPTPIDAKKVPVFANHIVKFYDEQERQETVDRIVSFLSERGINFIEL